MTGKTDRLRAAGRFTTTGAPGLSATCRQGVEPLGGCTMACPTVKTLVARGFDVATAKRLRGVMDGTADPNTFKSVRRWIDQCFHAIPDIDKRMVALNEILGGFGVEVIRGEYVDAYYGDIVAEYVNMGDTYDQTIVRETETGRYVACTLGDWVETAERRGACIV